MKYTIKIVLIAICLSILSSLLHAQTVVHMQQSRWYLKGSLDQVSDLSLFEKPCIHSVWKYDQNWQVYSTQSTIKNSSIDPIISLNVGEGFWVRTVQEDCSFEYSTSQELDAQNLKSGWNLLGATKDINISSFENSCVSMLWSYDQDGWKAYSFLENIQNSIENDSSIAMLETLFHGDGFWALASSSCTLALQDSCVDTNSTEITLCKVADVFLQQYFAPVTLDIKAYSQNKLYYYAETSSSIIDLSMSSDGKLKITPTNNSVVGDANITLFVFTQDDVKSLSFVVSIKEATLQEYDPLDFIPVGDEVWDETAVRKVLNTFAFGGHASDTQITTWAGLSPQIAIQQMLSPEPQNSLLSPQESFFPEKEYIGSLEALSNFWNLDGATNPMLTKHRSQYNTISSWGAPSNAYYTVALLRGTNPFRHRVGLWETNYHMSVNQSAGIYPRPLFTYYDSVLDAFDDNGSYHNVMATGAKSAAVAYQYGHNRNRIVDGIFYGNEDFGREYHQLFFGILGEYDHDYHEKTAIRNTARALTDMNANWHTTDNNGSGPDAYVTFGTKYHPPYSLEILESNISGTTAEQKIENIAQIAIEHNESLSNLPVLLVSHFADDNLTEDKLQRVQSSWHKMPQKNLLKFLWAYATSEDFHSPTRYKYKSSFDRNIQTFNKMILTNQEVRNEYHSPETGLWLEGVSAFVPIHDVFGHQRGLEASDNPEIFQRAYNHATASPWKFLAVSNDDENWTKDWSVAIEPDINGNYPVEMVAQWLWDRFISDGGKHFGELEKAHLYALLNGKDLGYFLLPDAPTTVLSENDLQSYVTELETAKKSYMDIANDDVAKKKTANRRVGMAIAFLYALPYSFAEEGR